MKRSLTQVSLSIIIALLALSCFSDYTSAYEPEPITGFQFEIKEGVNLISIPLIPSDANASLVFPQPQISDIGYWNPAIQDYVFIKVDGHWIDPGYCIEVGDAYWVIMEGSPQVIAVHGVKPDSPFTVQVRTRAYELRADIFGVPATENIGWSEVAVFNLDIAYIRHWDAEGQHWVMYTPGNLSSLILEPGKGYAIRSWQPGTMMFFGNMTTPEYEQLQSRYDALQSNYSSLSAEYDNLVATHNSLQANFNALNSTCTALQNSHEELQSQQEVLTDELGTLRNLNYLFIATTIVFTVATIFFAVRKPKIKPQAL